jgi:hypothetical protein
MLANASIQSMYRRRLTLSFPQISLPSIIHTMKSKTLASTNPYLKSANADEMIIRSLASSCAIESGKPVDYYITLLRKIRKKKSTLANPTKSTKKSST